MNAQRPIRVLIADDHPLVRSGMSILINADLDLVVVGEAADGCEAIAQFRAVRPDLTLLDLRMPIVDGLHVARAIRQEDDHAKILVVSATPPGPEMGKDLAEVIQGFILKADMRSSLAHAIRSISEGVDYFSPDWQSR